MSELAVAAAPRLLEWDSGFFGFPIARTDLPFIDGWAEQHQVRCAFLLAAPDDPRTVQEAEVAGWWTTDIRVTLDQPTRPWEGGNVRDWEPDDVDGLVALARRSHRITRFYADPNFDPDRCDDLYAEWMRNSLAGWARHVLVAGDVGAPSGYVTVHVDGDTGSIGLIAVREDVRRRHVGAALVAAAVGAAHVDGCSRMTVVTQGRNLPALRLFQRGGFLTSDVRIWLHRWWSR